MFQPLLSVDLTRGRIESLDVAAAIRQRWIGGTGLGSTTSESAGPDSRERATAGRLRYEGTAASFREDESIRAQYLAL